MRLSNGSPPPDVPKAEPPLPVVVRAQPVPPAADLPLTPTEILLPAQAGLVSRPQATDVVVATAATPAVPDGQPKADAGKAGNKADKKKRRPKTGKSEAEAAALPRRSVNRTAPGRSSGFLNAAAVGLISLSAFAVVTDRYQPFSMRSAATPAPVQTTVAAAPPPSESASPPPVVSASPPAPLIPTPSSTEASAPLQQPPASPPLVTAPTVSPPPVPPTTTLTALEPLPGAPAPPTETVAAIKTPGGEAGVIANFDAMIAPVRDVQPSVEDATRLRDAFGSMANPQAARALRDQLADPVAKQMIDWALHRAGHGSARDIKVFLDQNPAWPNRDLLTQRMEEQAFVTGGAAREIKSFFAAQPPKTSAGKAALASALLAEGNEAEAKALAVDAWRSGSIAASLETGFLERFAKLLTDADHKARFDRFLVDQSRWANERTDRANAARRVVAFLPDLERKKAEARLAVYLRQANADALLAALPADAATNPVADWGFAFQLVQWNRRAGRNDAAWKILTDAPTTADEAGNLDEWWEERRGAAYDALKAGRAQMAYDIVKAPGTLTVNAQKDHTFLAGFIALRHLKDAVAAEKHFLALEAAADGPLSRGKAGYWLALTYDVLKQPAKRKAALERAAKNWDTFYGQAARVELDPKSTELKLAAPATPTTEQVKAFIANPLVRSVVLARKSGLDQSIARIFLVRLAQSFETEAEHALVAHLAEAIGDTQMAVRIGKSAIARGFNLVHYAYPIHAMPQYQALRPSPETAIMLGIARQESEFNISTLSGAGARGLMQVMPITAQHVCRDYKIKCEIDRLSRDPSYNLMMAAAYIGDRMDEFTGSYVLTIAGYNAGPGRARQWIKEFGDPRLPGVDPIDWINRIPFEETRDYVQKVLSNVQVYRARLGEEATALRLKADLRRMAAATGRRASAEVVPPPSVQPAKAP